MSINLIYTHLICTDFSEPSLCLALKHFNSRAVLRPGSSEFVSVVWDFCQSPGNQMMMEDDVQFAHIKLTDDI